MCVDGEVVVVDVVGDCMGEGFVVFYWCGWSVVLLYVGWSGVVLVGVVYCLMCGLKRKVWVFWLCCFVVLCCVWFDILFVVVVM